MSGSDLFTGTLDLLIMRTVESASFHGYAIGKRLRDGTEGVLAVEEGALYPALHRLEARGLIESRWGRTETGRRARFYGITRAGARHLHAEAARWASFSGAVASVLAGGTD
jgi:transcriptional regulator